MDSGPARPADRARIVGRAALGAVLAFAALCAVAGGWIADPFIRNDDYLVYFPEPALTYPNTLSEGRWLNQLWALRGVPGHAPAHFLLALALWCAAAGLVAARIFEREPRVWPGLATSLALAAMPQMAALALWFNNLIASNLVLCAVAGLAALAPYPWVLRALPAGVALAFLSYPTNAFVVLALALAFMPAERGMRGAVLACALFLASAAASLLGIYAANWLAHGHFGILPAEWRQATPAGDLAGLWTNLRELGGGTGAWAGAVGAGVLCLGPLALTMALQNRPLHQRRLLLGAGLALVLVSAQSLAFGTRLPNRATGFVWVFAILALALAARHATRRRVRRIAALACLAAALGGLGGWELRLSEDFMRYQAFSRRVAERLDSVVPAAHTVLVTGDLARYPEAAVLNEPIAFSFRLADLTGAEVIYCDSPAVAAAAAGAGAPRHPIEAPLARRRARAAELCATHRPALAALSGAYPAAGAIGRLGEGVLGLRLAE